MSKEVYICLRKFLASNCIQLLKQSEKMQKLGYTPRRVFDDQFLKM